MANRTAWVAGLGVGFTWTAGINSADLASMAGASSVLGTPTITNQTALDIFCDISVRCAIASTTITAGAALTVWLYPLLDDGATYGDGQFVAGTQKAATPVFAPLGIIPIPAVAATTTLTGAILGVVIPPGSFKFALQNNTLPATAFTSGTQTFMYRTYNTNLNS